MIFAASIGGLDGGLDGGLGGKVKIVQHVTFHPGNCFGNVDIGS